MHHFLDILLPALRSTTHTQAILVDGLAIPCQVRRARLQPWRIGNQYSEQQPGQQQRSFVPWLKKPVLRAISVDPVTNQVDR